jgi:hypothetical protein
MKVLLAIVVSAVVALALTGCGGGGDEASAQLTPDERLTVATFNADVASTVLDGSAYGSLLDSMDQAIALARQKPDADYDGLTMRQVLSDAASDLQPYQPDLAAKLDRAVDTLGEGGQASDAPEPDQDLAEEQLTVGTDADGQLLQGINASAKGISKQLDAVNGCGQDTQCIEDEVEALGALAKRATTTLDRRYDLATARCARAADLKFRSALQQYSTSADLVRAGQYDRASEVLNGAGEKQDGAVQDLEPCAISIGIPLS